MQFYYDSENYEETFVLGQQDTTVAVETKGKNFQMLVGFLEVQ